MCYTLKTKQVNGAEMKLYNTETRQIENFVPYNTPQVTLYTCGPTVYHYAHIGNLRCYIMEDVLEKSLTFLGYKVKRAMNITDVGHLESDADEGEDKMLKGAEREHKTVLEIADFYTKAFKKDCEKLNIKWPENVVPATTMIDDYIKIISSLLEKGYAYVAGGNVYFDTSKLDNYYRLTNQRADDLTEAVRDSVSVDTSKKNKADFVLWFTKSKFEKQALRWPSPWGIGYPGWHIECSAISLKTLGEYLDIHCGGVDNKFPHHTNEIAQTESYVGHKWCKYWFHVEHLNTDSGKMSKSKGEFLTVSLLEQKGYNPLAYRFFCLQSHYRKPLVFSYDNLDGAQAAYDKLIKRIKNLNASDKTSVDKAAYNKYIEQFKAALANDLNTSLAVTAVFDTLKDQTSDSTKVALVREFDKVLSIGLADALDKKAAAESGSAATASAEVEALVKARTEAKTNKNYAEADRIRAEIKALGYDVVDTKDGPVIKKL